MENQTTAKTRYMAELALLSAVIVLMALTPLGYIRTPALSITLLTIPVAVGAIILGPKGGAVLGTVFGATSFAQALTGAGMTAILFQMNPLGVLFLCFVPRILEGFFCGLLFSLLSKPKAKKSAYYIAGFTCPVLNTLLFMTLLISLFYQTDYIQKLCTTLGAANPLAFVAALVGAQGLLEAVLCGLLAGTISIALVKALKR